MQIRLNAFNCKPENILKDTVNERLLARNKILLNKDVFVNGAYILENVIEGFKIFVSTEYIYDLKIINKISIDNFVINYYEKFILL